MTDYQKYINALQKCAKEHENDRTSTGHIIVSHLCEDTANLLEELEQKPHIRPKGKWIEVWDEDHLVILAYQCSECKTMRNAKTNYCADCGADMREVEE